MLSSALGVCFDVFRGEIIFPAFHNVLAGCGREKVLRVRLRVHGKCVRTT